MGPAIYVINLDRATERLAAVTEQVAQFGWSLERVAGIDARALTFEALAAIAPDPWSRYQGRLMTPGEIGCLASHRKAWRRIIDNRVPWALVLEDDAVLGPSVPEAVRQFEAQDFFDVVKLDGITTKPRKSRGVPIVPGPPAIFLMETVSAGAAACCITQRGAAKLLRITAGMNREADFFIRQYGSTDLVVGEVRPFVASQDRRFSYIGTERTFAAPRTRTAQLVRTLVRARESLSRRWRFHRLRGQRPVGPVSIEGSASDTVGREI